MPCTEAQKEASKRWRARNREYFNGLTAQWKINNADKQREYARKCTYKRGLYKRACKELFNCLDNLTN